MDQNQVQATPGGGGHTLPESNAESKASSEEPDIDTPLSDLRLKPVTARNLLEVLAIAADAASNDIAEESVDVAADDSRVAGHKVKNARRMTRSEKLKEVEAKAKRIKVVDPSKTRANVRENGKFVRGSVTYSMTVQDDVMKAVRTKFGFPGNSQWYRQFEAAWPDIARKLGLGIEITKPTYQTVYGWLVRQRNPPQELSDEVRDDGDIARKKTSMSPEQDAMDTDAVEPIPDVAVPDAAAAAAAEPLNADDELLLKLLEESKERERVNEAVRIPGVGLLSTPPIPITIEKVRKGREINISEAMEEALGTTGAAFFAENKIDGLHAIGQGGNGVVFRLLREGKPSGTVIKVVSTKVSYASGLKYNGIEAAAMYMSSGLIRLRRSRSDLPAPFALPADIMGGPAGIMWFPVTPSSKQGFTALFMQEGTPFTVEADRIAAEFTDPQGKISDDAMLQAARLCELILLSLQSCHNIGIRHGDVKSENLIMVPSGFAPNIPSIRTVDGKKAVFLIDFGSGMLPGVHNVKEGMVEEYTKQLATSTASTKLASARAATMVQLASLGKQPVNDEQAPGPGPQSYSIRALNTRFACAPSSSPGEVPMPVKPYKIWGGTEGYIPPEAHSNSRQEMKGPRLLSSDFMPGDMYAFGIMVLNIFAGGTKIDRLHPRTSKDKMLLCEAELRSLWHNYMGKSSRPPLQSAVPPEWELAIDFVKCILRADPSARLTATEALRHPFIELSRKRYF